MINTNSNRSLRAVLISLAALLGVSFFALKDYALRDGISLAVSLLSIAVSMAVIIILHRLNRFINEAFSIPFFLYLIHTGLSVVTGDYSDYYVLSLTICCLGAIFFNRKQLFKLIVVINIFSAAQMLWEIPFAVFGFDGGITLAAPRELSKWFITLLGSLFVYVVTAFAEGKNLDAKNAQDSFVSLLVATPDSIVLLDSLSHVTYISNSFMKLLGLDRSYMAKDRPIFDLLKDSVLRDIFYEILSTDDTFNFTREVVLNGQQYFFEIVVFELSGGASGRLVHISDITPVMKAKFEAEAASQSKSAFLATMSHEIRTPMNAIIGLSEIELQKKLPADTRSDLEKIHTSGANLLAIINDILDISKIEAGSFELIPVEYDLPSMVNDTIQLNVVRIGSKNITFKLKIDCTIPTKLFGDELRIKQILNNLLSNAFKYTEEGGVLFSVGWEKHNEDAWITFSVQDTGHGIKAEDLPRLFSEYRQLDAKANRHIEGTGLGLSITKNLISLMGGSINVESVYGEGTTFTVTIPQRIINESPIGEATAKNLELFRFREIHRSRGLRLVRNYMPFGKVLVVDDVETNLDVARGLLLPYGLSIDTAFSGPEAIEKIKAAETDASLRYDLILMDHMMPGMDGLEAVRIIRGESGEYGQNVPIVALTANALAGNEEKFLANGFNAFISKPVDVMQLDAVLNTWVRSKQSLETLRQADMELTKNRNENSGSSYLLDGFRVQGIDFVLGKERYSNEAAYLEILRSWYVHTSAQLEKLRNPAEDTIGDYIVTVHGLKGSSYGICAAEIGKKAEALEQMARAGEVAAVQEENAAFIAQVEQTRLELGKMLEQAAARKTEKQKADEPNPALLAELLDAAKQYESTRMEKILEKIESFKYENGEELVVWLREQMDNLEYDVICGRLESVLSRPEKGNP